MKKITLIIIIAAITFTACKKSKVEEPVAAPTPTVVGLWKGKYSLTTTSPLNQDVIYYFKGNGNIYVYNGTDTTTASQKGQGFWVLSTFSGAASIKSVVATYYYFSTPSTEFTIRFYADKNFTKSNNPSDDSWGIGSFILNPLDLVPSGKIVLTKQ